MTLDIGVYTRDERMVRQWQAFASKEGNGDLSGSYNEYTSEVNHQRKNGVRRGQR